VRHVARARGKGQAGCSQQRRDAAMASDSAKAWAPPRASPGREKDCPRNVNRTPNPTTQQAEPEDGQKRKYAHRLVQAIDGAHTTKHRSTKKGISAHGPCPSPVEKIGRTPPTLPDRWVQANRHKQRLRKSYASHEPSKKAGVCPEASLRRQTRHIGAKPGCIVAPCRPAPVWEKKIFLMARATRE